MSESVSVDQVIGKTLFSKKSVPLKRLPLDSLTPYQTVAPGKPLGVVYSYILPSEGSRVNLYWMLQDKDGRAFYAEHKEGFFDFKTLAEQGAKTVKEIEDKKRNEEKPLTDKLIDSGKEIVKYLVTALIAAGVVYLVAKVFIDKKVSKSV